MLVFFVLGRNPVLSRLELFSYFVSRGVSVSEVVFDGNLLVLDLDVDTDVVPDVSLFGGVLHMGLVSFTGSSKDFDKFLEVEDLVPSDKFSFSVFGNVDPDLVKQKFKSERRRAVLKHGRRLLKLQDGSRVPLPKADFLLFLYELKGKVLFGLVSQSFDSEAVERRDMGKPVRRSHLAISPRLSKMLINLSGAKEGDMLLDPFCGVGGILQEALLKNIDVVGSDKDKRAVADARKNLEWLSRQYDVSSSYELKVCDVKSLSSSLSGVKVGAVACETPLGVLVSKKLTDKAARRIILDFERFIVPALKSLRKVKKSGALIALTLPAVRSFRVDVERVVEESGVRLVHGPVLESRPDQFVGRDIIVVS